MRRIIPVLLFLAMLTLCSALADENGLCDPVPDTLAPLLEGVPQDCLVLDAPLDIINALCGKLGRLPGVSAKAVTPKSVK